MSTLLVTKLSPPRLPHALLLRDRLFDQLNAGRHGRLTLIHAAAGYGKTTLAAAWLAARQRDGAEARHAWLTLESYDNDAVRFLDYFIAAWQQVDPTLSNLAAANRRSSGPSPTAADHQALLNQLINALAERAAPAVLVLDDWHAIENGAIQQLGQYWIEHVPPHIHTIITSRTRPNMPLARWRVRGQLTEVDAGDLQFTQAEVGRFLRDELKLALSDSDIVQLTAKTEGWVASLQLAALSLHGSADPAGQIAALSGSSRHLVAYLADEVMKQQSVELRQFLLDTSILNRFNAPLAGAVTGVNDSFAVLQEIDRRNLFIRSHAAHGDWYDYHPLFADFLKTRLAREQPERYLANHSRAFDWLATHDLPDDAMEHGLAAQRYEDVARLLAKGIDNSIWRGGRAGTVFRWCAALPDTVLAAQPKIALAFGWAHAFLTRYDELASYLRRLRALFADNPVEAAVNGELTALEAEVSLYQGDIDAVLRQLKAIDLSEIDNEWLRAMLQQLYGYALRVDGAAAAVDALTKARQLIDQDNNHPLWVYATGDLAAAEMIQGNLAAAGTYFQEIFTSRPSEPPGSYPGRDFVLIEYAAFLLKRNQLDDALDHAQRGIALSQGAGRERAVTRNGLVVLARIRQAQGAGDDARQIMDQVVAAGRRQQSERVVFETRALRARLYLLEELPEPVTIWAATVPSARPPLIPRLLYHTGRVIVARWRLSHDPAVALAELTERQAEAEASQWLESLLEITILQVAAHKRHGQNQAALARLQHALALARPGGYLRPFVEMAADLAPLLRSLSRDGLADAFVGRIQAAFLPAGSSAQPLIEPLSARELEVLQLLAGGLSNPEIGRRLIIATGTVARHTNNIFGKLGVRNRTEATVRARHLSLI